MYWSRQSGKLQFPNAALYFVLLVLGVCATNVDAAAAAKITGKPKTTVDAGSSYYFRPKVSGLNDDRLRFSIKGKPEWADFRSSDGRIWGRLGESDVGTFSNIVIKVTDGSRSATLGSFSITVVSGSDGTTEPPSDGTTEPPSDGTTEPPSDGTTEPPSGGTTQPPSDSTPPPPVNSSGTSIAGKPKKTLVAGSKFWFRPSVSGLRTDKLRFSITGKPEWAEFRSSNGRLKGYPGESDVGRYENITIVATDGKKFATLTPFSITVTSQSGGTIPSVGGGNSAPTISGQAPSSVIQDSQYSFTPTATDSDGDALSFSVALLPGWASFSSSSGRLRGTPRAADVGTYDNIVISVSDGSESSSLGPFSISVDAFGNASVALQWTPPTRNTDGSRLDDLVAYRIDWGRSNGAYTDSVRIDNPGLSSYVVDNLANGDYKFVVVAINAAGVASDPSNVATKSVP